ncbi:hypothetical protein Tco_0698513 [Tanacetum coccineum]
MSGPEYPEYLAPSDEEVPVEDQPYVIADSPIALSSGFVADSDPEEDSKDGPVDYPADGGDGDDDDSSDNDEEEEASNEEDEEHLAPTDSVVAPVVDHVPSLSSTYAFSIRGGGQKTSCLTTTHTSTTSSHYSLSPPSVEERLARCLAAPALPSSPLPIVPHPYGSPNHVRAPPGFRAAMASLFIPPPVDRREDIPEAELPPRKRLCLTALTSRYEVGESSTAAPRPTGGHRIDYGFIGTLDAETRRQRAEEVGYGIRDVWVDPIEAVEEVAPTTLEGVNARVTELAAVQEQDIQDIYDDSYSDAGLPYRLTGVTGDDIDCTEKYLPPGGSSATASALLMLLPSMTAAAVEQLIRSKSQGDGKPQILTLELEVFEGVVLCVVINGSRVDSVFISAYDVFVCGETKFKFATCTFLGNALTWWNSHMKTVTQNVAYAMEYEVEKYVGGLPDMIRGNGLPPDLTTVNSDHSVPGLLFVNLLARAHYRLDLPKNERVVGATARAIRQGLYKT